MNHTDTAAPPDWFTDAACRGMSVELFFPERGETGKGHNEAKAVCAGCPVRRPCLNYALDEHIVSGTWGGLSERERRQIRSRRRSGWAA